MSSYPIDPTSDIEQLRRQLREADNTIEELRGKAIEALLSARERATLKELRDTGAPQEQIDAYLETRRIIRQSDAAKNRADQLSSRVITLEQMLAKSLAAPANPSPAAASNGHMHAKVYTADGFQISLNLPIATTTEAQRHMDDIRAAGLLPFMPETLASEKSETIVTAIRREHWDKKTNKVIPVVDLFPEWRGDYGQFRFVNIYLDTPEDIAEFERHSGLKLADMPISEKEGVKRIQLRPLKEECACKPFVAIKEGSGMMDKDGKSYQTYRFSRYGGAPAAKPAEVAETPAPIVPTSMIPANVQATLTSAMQANPFDTPAVKEALGAAIKNAGLTGAGVSFLFANIIPSKTLARVGDAHPDITPDEFMKRLPGIGQQYLAHLQAQTQSDPDDDPTPSSSRRPTPQRDGKPASRSASAKTSEGPFAGPRSRIDTPLNGRTGSSTRKAHPLEGEEVEIDRIEVARDNNGGKLSEKWVGHGTAMSASGTRCAFKLNIWKEDARRIREAGYTINWPGVENNYAPCLTSPAPVVIVMMRGSGLSIRSVQPAIHPDRREKTA